MKKKISAISLALIMAIAGVSVHSYKNNALAKLATDNIEALTYIDGCLYIRGEAGSCGAYWYNLNTAICLTTKANVDDLTDHHFGNQRNWCCSSCLTTAYCDYEALEKVYF